MDTSAQIFARNLEALLDHHRDKQGNRMSNEVLGRASGEEGVTGKMIAKYLDGSNVPRIDKLDAIAGVFGHAGWELLVPSFTPGIHGKKLARLCASYCRADPAGRELIDALVGYVLKPQATR